MKNSILGNCQCLILNRERVMAWYVWSVRLDSGLLVFGQRVRTGDAWITRCCVTLLQSLQQV